MNEDEPTLAPSDCLHCGHPVGHHEAGECWTNGDGSESVETTCGCGWYEPIENPKQPQGDNSDDEPRDKPHSG